MANRRASGLVGESSHSDRPERPPAMQRVKTAANGRDRRREVVEPHRFAFLHSLGRECEFADAGSCRRVARCRHRQQSGTLLTHNPARPNDRNGRRGGSGVSCSAAGSSAIADGGRRRTCGRSRSLSRHSRPGTGECQHSLLANESCRPTSDFRRSTKRTFDLLILVTIHAARGPPKLRVARWDRSGSDTNQSFPAYTVRPVADPPRL
ncbi:hypothetical protein OKW39_000045 [Paraburkholderia sp. MM6662-R1]